MYVLQFAFDDTEKSTYLPYQHNRNSVVYTGTHDNMTTRGWIESTSDHDRDFARRYINSVFTDYGQFTWDFIREAHRSVADTCIIPIMDYLVKGNEARLNTPAVGAGNWTWRCTTPLSPELAKSIRELTKLYGRIPLAEPEEEEEDGKSSKEGADEKTAPATPNVTEEVRDEDSIDAERIAEVNG